MDESHRLLLVDDDPILLRAYRNFMAQRGFAVETAEDGKTALEIVARGGIEVVVSDVSMPEMDGLELLRAVRADDLDLPVILMTGEPRREAVVQAMEHGAFRYLIKPVDPVKLEEVILRA